MDQDAKGYQGYKGYRMLITKEYTYGVSKAMAFAITTCGIMTMVGNWLIGKISDLWGVSAGMSSLIISGIAACILLLVLSKQVGESGISVTPHGNMV